MNDKSHDEKIEEHFWDYCKDVFKKEENICPKFDKETCENYFKNILKKRNVHKKFDFPSWLKKLEEPEKIFDLSPPSYKEIIKSLKNEVTRLSKPVRPD